MQAVKFTRIRKDYCRRRWCPSDGGISRKYEANTRVGVWESLINYHPHFSVIIGGYSPLSFLSYEASVISSYSTSAIYLERADQYHILSMSSFSSKNDFLASVPPKSTDESDEDGFIGSPSGTDVEISNCSTL